MLAQWSAHLDVLEFRCPKQLVIEPAKYQVGREQGHQDVANGVRESALLAGDALMSHSCRGIYDSAQRNLF